jgi:hypothetical protein
MDEIFTAAFWVTLWRDQWPVVTGILFVITFIVGWKLRKDDREIRELRATMGVLQKRERAKKEIDDTLINLERAHRKVGALFRRLA